MLRFFREIRELFRTLKDPITGDQLTNGEVFSLLVARILRRWAFLFIFTVISVTWWIFFHGPNQLAIWNIMASYMAIVVEGAMAIVIFKQVYRDAVVLREIRAMTTLLEQTLKNQADMIKFMLAQQQDQAELLKEIHEGQGDQDDLLSELHDDIHHDK